MLSLGDQLTILLVCKEILCEGLHCLFHLKDVLGVSLAAPKCCRQPNTLLTAVHKLCWTPRAALIRRPQVAGFANLAGQGLAYRGCSVYSYSTSPMHSALLEFLNALSVQLAVTECCGL